MLILAGLFLIGLGLLSVFLKQQYAAKATQRVTLQYGAEEVFASTLDKSLVALSFSRRQVVLSDGKLESTYSFAQILSAEVIVNGSTALSVQRSSDPTLDTSTSAGLRSVIAGLSRSVTAKDNLRSLSLKVVIDDQRPLTYFVPVLKTNGLVGLNPDKPIAQKNLAQIESMYNQLTLAMRGSQTQSAPPPPMSSGPSFEN